MMPDHANAGTRVDLHLHSRASGTASNWWVRGLGAKMEARESYTPLEKAYRMVKKAGMDFATLTDHETVEGALTLLHHPDFFVGEEVSARFPEDGSHVDVLVYELDAASHREVQARRGNVHALVDYLREAGLIHVLAHPIYGMPNPVTREGVERRLVLFGLWELVNGSRPAEQNRLAAEIAARTDAVELRQLATRHGLPTPPHRSITGTGGSDDHGGIYGGTAHTVAPEGITSTGEFLEAMADGEVWAAGNSGSVAGIVHTGFRIASQAFKEGDGREDETLDRLAARASLALPKAMSSAVPSALPFFRPSGAAKKKLMGYVPRLARLPEPKVKAALAGRYEARLSEALSGMGSGFPAVDFLSSVGDLIDGHLYVAPYVGVHGYFGRERSKAKSLRRELFSGRPEAPNTGVFVDGMDGVHGVATMYRNLQARSEVRHDGRLRLVHCGSQAGEGYSLRQIASLPVPLYDGFVLGVPSLLDVLEHIAEEGYDVLHVATPGPLGLAALVSGIALGLPVVGAYHTEFGLYARALSGTLSWPRSSTWRSASSTSGARRSPSLPGPRRSPSGTGATASSASKSSKTAWTPASSTLPRGTKVCITPSAAAGRSCCTQAG